jgi:hypothetical protein
MKLHRGCDVVPDGSGLVCRQGRLGGVIVVVVFGAACFFPAAALWWGGGSPFFYLPLALAAAVVTAMFVGDARARFRDTNWVLWIRPDSLCINLRSYQDRSPLDSLSVVELSDEEIAELQRHIERYTTPKSNGGTIDHKLVSLDIILLQADRGELAAALAAIRRVQQPWTKFLGMSTTSRVTVYSVSLPGPKRIRMAWYGGTGHGIAPRLKRVLAILAPRLNIAEPADDRRRHWREIPDAAVDDEILKLLCTGNRLDAIKLMKVRRGLSTTEAHRFVEELNGRVGLP